MAFKSPILIAWIDRPSQHDGNLFRLLLTQINQAMRYLMETCQRRMPIASIRVFD